MHLKNSQELKNENCVCLRCYLAINRVFPTKTPPSRTIKGLDGRDVAFMERLQNLAREALTWEHLSNQQCLVWAAALELDAVPVQEMRVVGGGCFYGCAFLAIAIASSSSSVFPLGLQELPPWFLERQNITRRPRGR